MKGRLVALRAVEGVIGAACVVWLGWWFISPERTRGESTYLDDKLGSRAHSRFFRTDGREGSILLFQAIPFVVAALLSFVAIELRHYVRFNKKPSNIENHAIQSRFAKVSTYPLWVHSPLGVLTVGDVLFILGVLLVTFYHFSRVNYLDFQYIDMIYDTHMEEMLMYSETHIPTRAWRKFNYAAYYFATAAIVPFALLWIPVSRGSPFLRLIGLPFEHAVKYHTWLAMLMLFLLSLHSLGYIIFYMVNHDAFLISQWVTEGESCSVVAGVVAWVVGLMIWWSSSSIFRRSWYDFFFRMHHLYIVFTLFWLYHAVWSYHFFIIPILLFLVDRFLRMVQSRCLVDVLSAKVLESGAIELKLARDDNEGLVYHSLSSWRIQIPSLAKFQWHFFSVTSTPIEDRSNLTIVIKPLGGWTNKLHDQLIHSAEEPQTSLCPFSFKARVEGPYGDESNFYLRYQTLVLVGGGIGVTPLLAILRDILCRHKVVEQKSTYLPQHIELYHCVRKPEELCVLNGMDPNAIFPDYEKTVVKIKVHAYITSKRKDDYSEDELASYRENPSLDLSAFRSSAQKWTNKDISSPLIGSKAQGICGISTSGDTKWVALITILSLTGYFILSGLANLFIVRSYAHDFPNYNRVHIIVACLILGVTLFGGIGVVIWFLHLKKLKHPAASVVHKVNSTTKSPLVFQEQEAYDNEAAPGRSPWRGDLHLQRRPNWKDIFDAMAEKFKGQEVGVLVSGSQSMQEDIARECRRHSSIFKRHKGVFNYHSVSFEL